jgi:L-amino acid N-acyltransferase
MPVELINCNLDAHGAAVREIFNDAIANTTALYEYQPRSQATIAEWFGTKARSGFPIIGAVTGSGELMGFASYGVFRQWPAYKYTVEHSIYVHPSQRRQGIARALLGRVIECARNQHYHALIGGIDAGNVASIALHQQAGFVHAGTLRETGFKFGRWLDLAFYQLLLPTPSLPADG